MSRQRVERPNERVARYVVSTALAVDVVRVENRSAASHGDARFVYADGRRAMLAVVADQDSPVDAQWAALENVEHRLTVPGLRGTWVAQLAWQAKLRDVGRDLPRLAIQWQHRLKASGSTGRFRGMLPVSLHRLGVRAFDKLREGDDPGVIRLMTEGWSGTAGSGELGPFVERVLDEHRDVPAKLARCSADERHAFIWVTTGSDFAAQYALEDRDQPPPTTAPNLPRGVSHVWVAGSSASQGVLAWFPDRGWWRTPFVWPSEGPATVD